MAEKRNLAQDEQPVAGNEPCVFASDSLLAALMREAWAKAESARHQWQRAELVGDVVAAKRHKRLMCCHQAIARHLEKEVTDEPV